MENAQPAVSLLIPIYNVERYLSECLDSAIGQTLKDIEIICINDGSTDSSPEIIARYAAKDNRIKVIDKPNSGYGCSMNLGLQEATGEYVGILESDDFFEPDALESLYRAAKEHDADVVKADFWFYWSVPEPRDERFGWVDEGIEGVVAPLDCPEVFFRKPSIWSAIYRREFLESNDIRFLETPGASYQDAGFNFKVWAAAETAVLMNKPILHYRQDNESSSVNSPGKVFCVCDEYAEMHRYVEKRFAGDKKKELIRLLVRMRFDSYMWNYERLSESLRSEFFPRMRDDLAAENARGVYDRSLFDDIKQWRRELIVDHPDLFQLQYSSVGGGGLSTAWRYFRAGGFPYLINAYRVSRR